jgi:protein O-mannosyl-transferase
MPSVGLCHVLLLLALTIGVFGHTVTFDFISLDDPAYVTENPDVLAGLSGEGVLWAFTATGRAALWQPLTWLSLMLDATLYGDWAGGYHLTNVLLHCANTLLLYVWLNRLLKSPRRSLFVAAVFGIHPLHVESVAWVTERKDVLSVFFGLLAIIVYTEYVSRGRQQRWYLATAVLMTLSLMAKQMLVTLPFVFLLLDFWPLRRRVEEPFLRRVRWFVAEKIPLLMLSAVFSYFAYEAQSAGNATAALRLDLQERLSNAVVSYVTYLRATIWPADLSPFYPHPEGTLDSLIVAAGAASLAGVTMAAVLLRHRAPAFLVGWLWFLGTLVPVIGLVQVGMQARADRFMYFPMIGLLLGVGWCIPRPDPQRTGKAWRGVQIGGALVIVGLACTAARQTTYWQSDETLFQRAVRIDDNNWLAHAVLGGVYVRQFPEHQSQAEFHLNQSIEIRPDYPPARFNRALLLSERGQLEEANRELSRALELDPNYSKARYVLCVNLYRMGRIEEYQKQAALLQFPDGSDMSLPAPTQ